MPSLLRSRLPRRAAVLLAPLLLAGLASPTGAAAATPPGFALVAASDSLVVRRSSPRSLPANLGIRVAAPDGDVELHVRRPDPAGPLEIHQVDSSTGDVLRALPAEQLKGWNGLRAFLRLRLTDAAGSLVLGRAVGFCPNSYQRERIHDEGPIVPRYPDFCGGHPLTRGMVWGVDHGWAVNPFDWAIRTRKEIPDGTYDLTVWIAEPYRTLFEIAPEDASVSISLRLRTSTRQFETASDGRDATEPLAAVPVTTTPDPSTLPDLRSHPAWGIGVSARRDRDFLTFAATEWNAGPQPLVVEGFREPDRPRMRAFQYFYENGAPVAKARVGRLAYDSKDGHRHWHFLQFVRYSILDASEMEVVRSRKEAFCLVPTDPVDLTVPGANWRPWEVGLGSACGGPRSLWIRETLDVGWGDTYHQSTPGQSFDITRLPNGPYYVSVQVNPDGRLYESDTANNRTLRFIRLRGRPGARRVDVPPWNGIDV